MDTKHLREEVLCQCQGRLADAVLRHHKPPSAAFINSVRSVASCRLRDMVEEGWGITQKHPVQHWAFVQFSLKCAGFNPQSVARHPDEVSVDELHEVRLSRTDKRRDKKKGRLLTAPITSRGKETGGLGETT